MSHDHKPNLRLSMNPVALSSYSVAICSFAAAGLGLVVSHIPAGPLAAIGAFYLIVGLINRTPANADVSPNSVHRAAGHTSGAENLVAEAIAPNRETEKARNRDLVSLAK